MRGFYFNCLLFLILLPLGKSCNGDPDNYAPEIEDILMEPADMLVPGLGIKVSALVIDRDGDDLVYLWESDGGELADVHGNETTWTIHPTAEPGSYESLSLTVSDGKENHRYTKSIQVSEGYRLFGLVSFCGTTIPVRDARVEAGELEVQTDSSGQYLFPSLRPGEYPLKISKEGFDLLDTVIHVKSPRSVFNAHLSSRSQTGTLSGNIATHDGISFEGLRVTLLNPDQSESEISVLCGQDGDYILEDVPKGTRYIKVRNEHHSSHFLNDSLLVQVILDVDRQSHDVRIKVLRQLFRDKDLSGVGFWEGGGSVSNGFYRIDRGETMSLREYIVMPGDAEKALLQLNSYVVGGCDMIGKVPSHRLWISNEEGEYIGGISWGGEGSNYPAILDWYPSETPTYLGVFGKSIKLNLEVYGENTCIPDPFWRIYEIALSYYY